MGSFALAGKATTFFQKGLMKYYKKKGEKREKSIRRTRRKKKRSDLSGSERGGADGLVEGSDLGGGAGDEGGSSVSNGLATSLAELLRASHRHAVTVSACDQLQAVCYTGLSYMIDCRQAATQGYHTQSATSRLLHTVTVHNQLQAGCYTVLSHN